MTRWSGAGAIVGVLWILGCGQQFVATVGAGGSGAATTGSTGGQGGGSGGGTGAGGQGGTGGSTGSAGTTGSGGTGGGTCTADLLSDPKSCGACGHDCLGGACKTGKCQPVKVVSGQAGVIGVAVTPTHLYWAVGKEIRRATLPSGPPQPYLTGTGDQGYLSIRAGWIYWTERPGGVHGKELNGPGEVSSGAAANALGIACDGKRIVWTEYTDTGKVRTLPLGALDGSPELVAGGQNYPEGVTIGPDGSIFWATYHGGQVSQRPPGGAIQVLAPAEPGPAGVATDADFLYWGTQDDQGRIVRRPLAGGKAETLATSPGTQPTGIVVTDSAIVWADSSAGVILLLAK